MLRKNNLVSPNFKTYILDGTTTTQLPYFKNNCHFLHEDPFMVAAINACQDKIIVSTYLETLLKLMSFLLRLDLSSLKM